MVTSPALLALFCATFAVLSTIATASTSTVGRGGGSDGQQQIAITQCDDALCRSRCRNETTPEGECVAFGGGPGTSAQLTCETSPNICAAATVFADAACSEPRAALNHVCNGCQFNYSLACGALHGALFWAVNCSDSECENCGGAIIVPFGQCTFVPPIGHVIVSHVYECDIVSAAQFASSSSCAGAPTARVEYPSGECVSGAKLTCEPQQKRKQKRELLLRRLRN